MVEPAATERELIAHILPMASSSQQTDLLRPREATTVTQLWSRIEEILCANLELEYSGASDDDIHAAEASTNRWPDELRELYRCVEHASDRRGMVLLPPGYEFMSLDGVTSRHALWDRLARNPYYGPAPDFGVEMAKPAGSPAEHQLPAFIPFANADADTLFVDTRSGPLHGCIRLWPDEDWAHEPPLWLSINAMLSDLAFSLERNSTLTMHGTWRPFVEDRQLVWEQTSSR